MSVGTHARLLLFLIAVAISATASPHAIGDTPGFLRIFKPTPSAAAGPVMLTEEEGPWMILAHTFIGEDSKGRAQRLTTEIRSKLKLPAFMYHEKFDFTGNPGVGSTRLRYANEYQYEAYAVLVGEYDNVQHPNINRDLKTLKNAMLPVFQSKDIAKETDLRSPITTVKAVHQKLIEKVSGGKKAKPMGNAFVTRNPMLPEKYFESPAVDSFVKQLNEDKQYSLLECEGKYTVVVRTFEGFGTIVDGRKEKNFVPSMRRLDRFAEDAGKMVAGLRKKGEEAYQFHDRYRSLVTVGSFDTLGRQLPNGRFEYAPEIRRVMEKYSALNSKGAQNVNSKTGFAANHVAMIPFDVQPKPIAVPKASKRSLYTAAFRTR